jgi:hypothetical protein
VSYRADGKQFAYLKNNNQGIILKKFEAIPFCLIFAIPFKRGEQN